MANPPGGGSAQADGGRRAGVDGVELVGEAGTGAVGGAGREAVAEHRMIEGTLGTHRHDLLCVPLMKIT